MPLCGSGEGESTPPLENTGRGILVSVRRGKTNQEGETKDVRFVKGGVARAIRTLRAAASPAPEPGRVDHRRDARELEDEPDGRALLGRGARRAREL